MNVTRPLTVTVEQAAEVLGVARSTAYELVRTGELGCLRLRRRIVVPIKFLADQLGVTPAEVRASLTAPAAPTDEPRPLSSSRPPRGRPRPPQASLFEAAVREV